MIRKFNAGVIMLRQEYYAHSEIQGRKETVIEHLLDVARLAAMFAADFGGEREAEMAGLLHDIGKYGELFQRRLEHKEQGIDHWSLGAWVMLTHFKRNGIAGALAIQGHHIGLQNASEDALRLLAPSHLLYNHPLGLRLSETSERIEQLLKERFTRDNGGLNDPNYINTTNYVKNFSAKVSAMLDVRMLYSTLVDADFISTESHFNRDERGERLYRKTGQVLAYEQLFALLEQYLETIRTNTKANNTVRKLREDLLAECLESATKLPGLFTLSAPTGSGKTIAMLAFALKHARANQLKRIIIVLPYLNIIEQTTMIYRSIFAEAMNESNPLILEDHSLAHIGANLKDDESQGDTSDREDYLRKHTENWDAPIIITTTVKFFEALFSNRSSTCRKLHNISRSVVLFDEAQTLPLEVTIPSLAALSHLWKEYGTSIVLATATQPAFEHLSRPVSVFSASGWHAQEIVRNRRDLFGEVRRVKVVWPDIDQGCGLLEIANRIIGNDTVLCIVNLKRHAQILYESVAAKDAESLYHISTNMCTRHRQEVLAEIKERLQKGIKCRVIATQCVEAGVDLDFPVVYRSWGPLESLAQAAGRCNREGRLEAGIYQIFLPEKGEERYPGAIYELAANVTKIIFKKHCGNLDLQDPQIYEEYYRELYGFANFERMKPELTDFIKNTDFVETTKHYRIIENDAVNVLVPYEPETFATLSDEAIRHGITASWLSKARPYMINVYRPKYESAIAANLQPVTRGKKIGFEETDWFIYLRPEHYHPKLGLVVPEGTEVLIA